MHRDELYALPRSKVGDFTFDDAVATVFPDMIARSVPGYASVLSMIEQLTVRYARPDTNIYDLGCSLGAGTLLIRRQAPPSCVIHAVDNSDAMISRLTQRLSEIEQTDQQAAQERCKVFLIHEDVNNVKMSNASFVILNWTLQFIAAEMRDSLLKRICESMIPGGAILLSEKVAFDNPEQNELLIDLHHDFKRANGYSDLEIAQKRTSLENRLIPESMQVHVDRLRRVGFKTVSPWFQCFNFASFLAVK